jgi:hypothetical protein
MTALPPAIVPSRVATLGVSLPLALALPFDREALPRWLLSERLVDSADLLRARKRARVYGGSLDTALLELGLCDEATLGRALPAATGLPGSDPAWLRREPKPAQDHEPRRLRHLIDEPTARRLRAQPVGTRRGQLQIAITPAADLDAVAAWAEAQHDRRCDFHIVSELRFEALVAHVHDVPPPARFLRLLARLAEIAGEHAAGDRAAGDRAAGELPGGWLGDLTPVVPQAKRHIPAPPAETGPSITLPSSEREPEPEPEREPEIDVSEDLTETGFSTPAQLAALVEDDPTVPAAELPPLATLLAEALETRAGDEDRPARLARLRPHLHEPELAEPLARWRAEAARGDLGARTAIATLVEVRDGGCVPELITLIDAPDPLVAEAARAALRTLTAQDFGAARWRWILWWRTWGKKHRVEWLLEALSAPDPERRLQAAHELEAVTGQYVGYHFDLGRRERQAARRRWQRWWDETGRSRFGRA